MARKRVQKKTKTDKSQERHDIHMILLGIVAVLAIVGLVLMFNARMTGSLTATQTMPNPIITGKANPCFDVMPPCMNNEPRTANQQYLAPDGTIHLTCACPPSEPPVPAVEITVPLR